MTTNNEQCADLVSEITASEAVYGFAGWLTVRSQAVTFGATHDAAIVAELVAEFISHQGLTQPRENYHLHLKRFPAEPAKCDGNHGGPRCADPECWNDSPAEAVKTPSTDEMVGAIIEFADARATITENRLTGCDPERNRLAHEDLAQAYADMLALLARYRPAAFVNGGGEEDRMSRA